MLGRQSITWSETPQQKIENIEIQNIPHLTGNPIKAL